MDYLQPGGAVGRKEARRLISMRRPAHWIELVALALLLPCTSLAQLASTQNVATGFAVADNSVATLNGWVRPEPVSTLPLTFSSAFAPYQQGSPYTVANSLLPNVEGWAVNGGANAQVVQTAFFGFSVPASGEILELALLQNHGDRHWMQLFEIAVTTDAAPNTAGGGNWTTWVPTTWLSTNTTLSLVDGTKILSIGTVPATTYTLRGPFPAQGITGVRLTLYPYDYDPLDALPATVGRAFNGNFVLSEIKAAASPAGTNSLAWFEWGLSTNFNQQTAPFSVGGGNFPVPVSAVISNVTPGLLHRCRLVLSNSAGLHQGNDVIFASPVVTLHGRSVVTNAWLTPYVEAGAHGFTEMLGNSPATVAGTVDTSVLGTNVVTYLSTNSLGGIGSATRTIVITTNLPGPVPVLAPVSAIASNTVARVTWAVNPVNAPTTAWFEWGWTTNYGSQTTPVELSGGTPVPFGEMIPVTPGLIYHGRVVALHSDGGVAFSTVTFGSPLLPLNGPAVMTNEFGTSYVEMAKVVVAPLALAGGARHSVALQGHGTVAVWGDNSLGQMNVPASATNVTAMASGGYHNLAVRSDGAVVAWGWNSAGQATVPAGLSNVTRVAAGEEHSLALRSNGSVVAWGNNSFGQATVPADLSNVVAVAAGGNHSLALRADGTVAAWGLNSSGQTNVPADLTNVIAIQCGYSTSLALQPDGTVVSWGRNLSENATNATAIAAGSGHGLALRPSGSVSGWGDDNYGQRTPPVGLTNAVMIAAGYNHSLALRNDGTVIGWGRNSYGQLTIPVGAGAALPQISGSVNPNVPGTYVLTYSYTNALGGFSVTTRTVVVPLPAPAVTTLATTGVSNTVATLNATVNPNAFPTTAWFEWGLIAGHFTQRTVPVSLGNGSSPVALSSNITGLIPGATYFGRVVATNVNRITRSDVFVFGSPAIAVNGPATLTMEVGTAYLEAGATAYEAPRAIVDTGLHSLVLRRDGTLRAWGHNYHGQLNLPAASLFTAIAANSFQDLALTTDGTVVSWGNATLNLPPVPAGLANVKAIAAGFLHNLALLSDGRVVGWGTNDFAGGVSLPTNLASVVTIAAGFFHNIALRADGTVAAWGENVFGQANVPAGLSNVIAVTGGGYHSLALRADGTVVGWGSNFDGQLNIPANLSNVVAIAGGGFHSLALRADGTVVAWGGDDYEPFVGANSVPPGLSNVVAIAASPSHNLVMLVDGTLVDWGTNAAPFAVDRTPPPDYRTIASPVSISGSVNANVAGTYLVKYAVTNSVGAVGTATRTVVIVEPPPIVRMLPAHTTNTVATLNALVNPRNAPTTAWFEWGQIPGHYPNQTAPAPVGSGGSDTLFTANVTGLTPGEIYRGRVVAIHADEGVAHGEEVLFGAPAVTLHGPALMTNVLGAAYVETGAASVNVPPAIAAGYFYSLALRANGTVAAWGTNNAGQASVPPGLDRVTAISARFLHSLALREDGSVVGWGDNTLGQRVIPTDLAVSGVAAGGYFSTVLRSNGTVLIASDNQLEAFGFANIPPDLSNVTAVAAGLYHSLALRNDGTVAGWGGELFGTMAVVPANLKQVRAISAGGLHSLALRTDGTVVAWGNNQYGQTNIPAGLSNVVMVSAGLGHTLALRTDGTVVAWGATNQGANIVPAGLSNVVAVSAGYFASMALRRDGALVTWGEAVPGPLPDLTSLPVTITGSVNWNAPGTYLLTYTSTNSFGGIGQATRTVFVTTTNGVAFAQVNSVRRLGDGRLQLTFSNTPGAPFTVLASTNVALPVAQWIILGPPTEAPPGHYQFTDAPTTNAPQRFYLIRSP